MQNSQGDFQCRTVFLGVDLGRDPPSVILYRDRIVLVDDYVNFRAITCQCFVYGVVHDFIYQMVKAFFIHVADVHGRAFAYGLQSFKYLDAVGTVIVNIAVSISPAIPCGKAVFF